MSNGKPLNMDVVTGAHLPLPKALGLWSNQGPLEAIIRGSTHIVLALSQALF